MKVSKLQPNSAGSIHNGYKLSNIPLQDVIEHSDDIIQICVGCDEDDTFYEGTDKAGRLRVLIETESTYSEFDLEQFLIEVKKLCPHLF